VNDLLRIGVDMAIVILLIEAFALMCHRYLTGRGLPYVTILVIAGAGLTLILAMRLALTDGSVPAMAVLLMLGGITHAVDLARRLTRKDRD
jgi:hypothetical protein